MSVKKILTIFSVLIIIQFFFSLVFSSHSDNECWKSLEIAGAHKGRSLVGFDQKILNQISGLLENYRLNCDAGGYMLLAHDFPEDYFRGRTLFINRPLYSFFVNILVFPFHLLSDSYSITFAGGLLANCLLLLITCFLLFRLLSKYFNERVSLISCILFIFSPFTHSWLVQPETNIFGAFAAVVVLYMLYNYISKPSFVKLITFSFLSGLLLLGKMNVALGFFVVICGLFFKKFKESIIFVLCYSLPVILWYLWVTQIWGLSFGVQEVSNFKVGIWIFDIIKWPITQTVAVFLDVIPKFINSLIYGFFLVPLFFALIGYKIAEIKYKQIIFFGMLLAYLMLFFALNIYLPRHAFLLFPLIYPLAVIGIDHIGGLLSKYKYFNLKVYYWIVYGFIVLPSFLNVIDIYNKLNVPYS